MKTNYQRDFVARNDRVHRSFGAKVNLPAKGSDMEVRVGASISHGGNKQEAHWLHGAKQFVHTRTRRREDALLRNEVNKLDL